MDRIQSPREYEDTQDAEIERHNKEQWRLAINNRWNDDQWRHSD